MNKRQYREVYRVISTEFDKEYYVNTYPDIAAEVARNPKFDIVDHYIRHGCQERRNPTNWFSTSDYLLMHDDVRDSEFEPFFHYLKYGRQESRSIVTQDKINLIRQCFDCDYYSTQYADIKLSGMSDDEMVFHYLNTGWKEGRNPNGYFNTDDYLNLNADVRQSKLNPFSHYIEFGKKEGRVPRQVQDRRIPASSYSPSVLFVGHSGNPAGAEIMLLDVIEWYAENTFYNIDVLILSPGPLVNHYQKYGRVYCLGEDESIQGLASVDFLRERYDYIYLNTVASGAFFKIYEELYSSAKVPLILHVHEMSGVIKTYSDELAGVKPYVTLYIGASDAVRTDLVNDFEVNFDDIVVFYSFIKIVATEWFSILRAREHSRRVLGIADDDFLVMGAGTLYARKGPDLFVDTLDQAIQRGASRVKAIWIGGGPDFDMVRNEVTRRGLADRIDFIGYRPNSRELIAAADLFFLSSREDPFPLVCLEAASYAIPTLHFRGCSGISTLTQNGAGVEVALAGGDAADAILALLQDSELKEELGLEARKRVLASYEAGKSCLNLFIALRERFGIAPAVSVIIPNYNHAKYLRQRISSVLSQTVKDVEIIILDDASTDDSREVIKSHLSDRRIQFFENEAQSGSPFKQWAKGLSYARARAVWIAESDDFCTQNFLEVTLPRLTSEIAISYCKTEIVNASGVVQENALVPYLQSAAPGRYMRDFIATGYDEVSSAMGFCCTLVNASSALFQRAYLGDTVDAAANYRMCGDWRIYLELLTKGGIAYTTKATNFFRRHANSAVHHLEGTDAYFSERSEIAFYAAREFRLQPKTANRIVVELESEWRRFSRKLKQHDSLSGFFDISKFWSAVGSRRGVTKNIAFYVHGMLFSKGGIEQQCALISRHLANQGFDVTIFCRLWGDSSPVFDAGQFVKVIPVFDENRVDETVADLRHHLVTCETDVFIPMLSEWLFEPIMKAAAGLNVKVIASEHNDPKKIEDLWWSHDRRVSAFEEADHIHLLLEKFRPSLPIEFDKKITVIPNGVEPSSVGLSKCLKSNNFIAIGRLVEQKGFDRLIKAMTHVVKSIPDATLNIYGKGAEHDKLETLIAKLGLNQHVRLCGETDQIFQRLSESTAIVVPSRFEGFGIVVVEAKIAGVPAIAYSDCNGPNVLITDHVDGLLVQPDETGKTLADAMIWLSTHPDERSIYQKNAYENSVAYLAGTVVQQWVEMVESVGALQFRGVGKNVSPKV